MKFARVLPSNRLSKLQTANCETCYDGVTCLHSKIRSQAAPDCAAFLYLAAEIGSRARVRNCVRFQNRGNSWRASLEIRYSLASCTPHLSRTMEFRALRWRNFSQAERKRDSEDVPFCGASSYREASRRETLQREPRTVLWDHECVVMLKRKCSVRRATLYIS